VSAASREQRVACGYATDGSENHEIANGERSEP